MELKYINNKTIIVFFRNVFRQSYLIDMDIIFKSIVYSSRLQDITNNARNTNILFSMKLILLPFKRLKQTCFEIFLHILLWLFICHFPKMVNNERRLGLRICFARRLIELRQQVINKKLGIQRYFTVILIIEQRINLYDIKLGIIER